jgi:hypothetical protein
VCDQRLRPRIITHGNPEEKHAEIWKGCEQAGRECDEEAQEGNVAKRTRWKGRQGNEQEASDRDWIVGGAREGRKGSEEAEVERWSEEGSVEAEMSGQDPAATPS